MLAQLFFRLCDCSFGKRAAARPALAGLPHKKTKKRKKNPCLPTAQPSLRLRSLHQSRRGNICPLSHSHPPPHFSDGPHGGNDGDGTNAAQTTSEEEGNHLFLLYFHFPFFGKNSNLTMETELKRGKMILAREEKRKKAFIL